MFMNGADLCEYCGIPDSRKSKGRIFVSGRNSPYITTGETTESLLASVLRQCERLKSPFCGGYDREKAHKTITVMCYAIEMHKL
jgi:hypothetical protein